MSVTAILIEPHRVTRVIFDGHTSPSGISSVSRRQSNVHSPRLMARKPQMINGVTKPAITSIPRAVPDDR
jgi:hypothetical protein